DGGDGDAPGARLGLGSLDDPALARGVDRVLPDPDLPMVEVYVLAAQAQLLASPQATEAGQEDEGTQRRADGVGQGDHGGHVHEGPLACFLRAGALHAAGVAVVDVELVQSRVEDGVQEPVTLGRLVPPGGLGDVRVPGAHGLGGDLAERDGTEVGEQVATKEALVPAASGRREWPTSDQAGVEPAPGEVLEPVPPLA